MTWNEVAITGFVTGLVVCIGLAKMAVAWGVHHSIEDIFRND